MDQEIVKDWITSIKALEEWSESFHLEIPKNMSQKNSDPTTKHDLKLEKALFHDKSSHQTPGKRKLENVIDDQELNNIKTNPFDDTIHPMLAKVIGNEEAVEILRKVFDHLSHKISSLLVAHDQIRRLLNGYHEDCHQASLSFDALWIKLSDTIRNKSAFEEELDSASLCAVISQIADQFS
jgi:uncharacterized membrane-anchored protein YjiN (DUF445 family)